MSKHVLWVFFTTVFISCADKEEEIKSATLKMTNDSINYCRQKNLWSQQIGSKIEYNAKKLAYQLSTNSLSLLKNKYDRTREDLKTWLQLAKNNYK